MCKRIKQSDWPCKFCGYRVFDYSRVAVVLALSVRKWPNLPWPPPLPNKFLHYYYLKLEIKEQKQKMVIKIVNNRISQFSWAIFLLSVEAYVYVKNLTCCLESLWTRLTTSTWNDWNCYFFCFLTTCKKLTS